MLTCVIGVECDLSDADPKVLPIQRKVNLKTLVPQRMSIEHPPTSLAHSLASSESTLDPNDQTDMNADNTDKRATFDATVESEEATRTDAPSEADDVGHDHDEANDSHIHSEEEDNDGTRRIRIILRRQTFLKD